MFSIESETLYGSTKAFTSVSKTFLFCVTDIKILIQITTKPKLSAILQNAKLQTM